mmetsp:Transcript_39867/g.81618  ORF Transcript_39867/g.81618 Transcript_39867/m.81618 type:complete len:500 (+) Transcript_39867:101-1600(+)
MMERLSSESTLKLVASLSFEELSSLLTLLDWLLGHTSALMPLSAPSEADAGVAATVNLASASVVHAQFLRAAAPCLSSTLATLGLRLCCLPNWREEKTTGIWLGLCPTGKEMLDEQPLSRSDVLRLGVMVEESLSNPTISLAQLQSVAEHVMELCIDLITQSKAAQHLDLDALRKCRVAPAVFFNEDWSVMLETAWQASGAEGLLTMPNYTQWTIKHASHRARSRNLQDTNSNSSFPWGRLWRLERFSCLQAPCHEVIHLVQHIARSSLGDMNLEVAEHDGSFSTCLLMLAVAQAERTQSSSHRHSPEQEAERKEEAGGASPEERSKAKIVFYPGAVEEALLEIVEYMKRLHSQETEEARERWSVQAREEYSRWRDSFGSGDMTVCWGTGGNFGGDFRRESLCKQVLALEAVFPNGSLLTNPAEISDTAEAMLRTMFVGRAEAKATGCDLAIAPAVRLSGIPVETRLAMMLQPLGESAAEALRDELCEGGLVVPAAASN